MKFLLIFVLIAIANASVIRDDFTGRILNGLNSTTTDYFALRVLSVRNDVTLDAHLSSGVAISENYGLVVAQAINDFQFWYIGYGSIVVEELSIQSITDIRVHTDYNPNTLENNIAVIKFTTPVTNYLPLAPGPSTFPIFMTFGFGLVDVANNILSQTLQHLIIMEIHFQCETLYTGFDPNTSICGSFPGNSLYTDGNQGGPLTDMNREYLYGIISYWGAENQPVVSLDILSYRSFIEESILELE